MYPRKKVAFYVGWPMGGVETYVSRMARTLPLFGWETVVLLNMCGAASWKSYYDQIGVEAIELPFRSQEDIHGSEYVVDGGMSEL